ncbi:hypothetical protein GH714_033901 [Hevea brasiliensis]|uniref:Uncharacterized protein n=1 Tax=Hevea brasiliensis TaxID=3981 RepID=A0A6A6LPS4_HEVBR|nr:hypothetical protein GH714_033901 [Hevea brasiliensis]
MRIGSGNIQSLLPDYLVVGHAVMLVGLLAFENGIVGAVIHSNGRVETHSQEWRKEIASMVIEAEYRQEARLQEMVASQEVKFKGIVDELKSLITGLSCQNVEAVRQKNCSEQSQVEEYLFEIIYGIVLPNWNFPVSTVRD